ncbi:hypothetical protein C0J52_15509 [Blattella germanica]|nr:hypothetical protein C0J52_15509 [Blattella germanica]
MRMWGFHDRLLTLRRALYGFMTGSECKDALWRRWRWQQTRLNTEAGFVYTEEEWRKEWDSIVSMASTEPRKQNTGRRRSMVFDRNPDEVPANATYESLEEVHVLALAHVLRRPIIVIADLMLKDVNGDDLAPIPFGGIYLPMECPSSDCHRSPLVLTYDAAHFSALVIMEKEVYADKIPQPPEKLTILDEVDKGLKKSNIAKQFSISASTLSTFIKDRNKIEKTDYAQINKAIYAWFLSKHEKKVEIDRPMLCAQAVSFITTFKISNFKGSTGWVHRFRQRYGIVLRSVCAMIPLTDFEHELLPIQFSVDPGEQFTWGKDENNSQIISKFTLAKKDKLELLHKYLDVATVPLLPTPKSEENEDFVEIEADPLMVMNNDEDEIDKKFAEVEADATDETSLADNNMFSTNRSKAAKQLQSVAKQFGSIGKSMSKKLKKNLGSITKITRNNSEKKDNGAGSYIPSSPIRQKTKLDPNIISKTQDYILCGVLHTEKRHEYQEEMIRNYLLSARERFQHDKELKMKQAEEGKLREEQKLKDIAQIEGASQCINPECNQLGTALTSYMCKDCFERQRERELIKINSPSMSRAIDNVENCAPKYGIGKSYFYTESDLNSHNTISRLPSTRVGSNIDQTLYLSKSTFYNDFNPFCVTDNKGESVGEHDSSRNVSQELVVKPGTYIHELSPTITKPVHISNFQNYNWQEDVGGTGRNMISKHNMAYHTGTQNSSDSAGQRSLSRSTTAKGSLGSSASARNVSVATLTGQSSNDLPKVERVGRDKNSQLSSSVSRSLLGAQPCCTKNCKFFGSAESDYYCSKCFKEQNNAVKSLKVQEMKR